jgi:PKHD-type hydroxylase
MKLNIDVDKIPTCLDPLLKTMGDPEPHKTLFSVGDLNFFGTRIEDSKKQLLNFYWFKGGFSLNECDDIISLSQSYKKESGGTFGGDEGAYRKSVVRWLPPDDRTHWIYHRLKEYASEANEIFSLDVCGFTEFLQFTEYEGKGSKYGSHVDIGPGHWHRKISIVVQLSDPNDYKGGDFHISTGGENFRPPKERGNVILFPSILQHEVLPLVSGNRYSLVSWVSGSPWK